MQKRIQVYADDEMKRRIELAAAKVDLPVTEYCMQAIRQRLMDDDMLERAKIEIFVNPYQQEYQIDRLRTLHARILMNRRGSLIDIDSILSTVREERDYELTSMH